MGIMERIRSIEARVVPLGNQTTVEVTVTTERRFVGVARLPLGVSVGANEARLVDPEMVVTLVQTVVAPALKGKDVLEQREVDELLMELDPTIDRSTLGVNALLPVSMAVARAGAAALTALILSLALGPLKVRLARTHPWLMAGLPLDALCSGDAPRRLGYTVKTLPAEQDGLAFSYDRKKNSLTVTWKK